MLTSEFTTIRHMPVSQLAQLRRFGLCQVAAFMVTCSPRVREAITQAVRAHP